mmetsp:Transcript_49272/g.107285  ORF Transcript_49272/g.107285 Transcript_49272/m.107285 type:complete len:278 (+) Transcript_49272:87-920(+)
MRHWGRGSCFKLTLFRARRLLGNLRCAFQHPALQQDSQKSANHQSCIDVLQHKALAMLAHFLEFTNESAVLVPPLNMKSWTAKGTRQGQQRVARPVADAIAVFSLWLYERKHVCHIFVSRRSTKLKALAHGAVLPGFHDGDAVPLGALDLKAAENACVRRGALPEGIWPLQGYSTENLSIHPMNLEVLLLRVEGKSHVELCFLLHHQLGRQRSEHFILVLSKEAKGTEHASDGQAEKDQQHHQMDLVAVALLSRHACTDLQPRSPQRLEALLRFLHI